MSELKRIGESGSGPQSGPQVHIYNDNRTINVEQKTIHIHQHGEPKRVAENPPIPTLGPRRLWLGWGWFSEFSG